MTLEYRQCFFECEEELQLLVDLQNEVYKKRGLHFDKNIFRHWYVNNPEGRVISFNAFDGDKMVAHQSFVPCRLQVGGKTVKAARSMSVVTLPEYQGKGIFSKITNMAVDYAQQQGYEILFAVTNGNSFGGFVKHAGFTFVTRLDVMMCFGNNIEVDGDRPWRNQWTSELLEWRLQAGQYFQKGECIIGEFKKIVNTIMGIIPKDIQKAISVKKKSHSIWPKLYVGWGAKIKSPCFRIPKFIKHSPFNFIYRDMTGGELPPITKEDLFYQLIDFDVA